MPRPKGSKNKAKPTTQSIDFTSLIAEKSSTKEALVADIATLEENLTSIREEMKTKKAELKKLDIELGKLEEQKAEVEAREAEEAKKAELEETIQKLRIYKSLYYSRVYDLFDSYHKILIFRNSSSVVYSMYYNESFFMLLPQQHDCFS